jgi:ATP/maltotriose-dependent transcriptional regulator MalT
MPDFDLAAAHRHFASHCFNTAWTLIEKSSRTKEEDEQLVALGHASFWHWSSREDCNEKNVAVGYWMLARIYALLGRAENAIRYAELCSELTERAALSAFYRGTAHEVLARAFHAAGNLEKRGIHLEAARVIAKTLDDEERRVLEDGLNEIG